MERVLGIKWGLVRRGGQGEWVGQLGVEVEGQVVGGFGLQWW